MSTSAKRYLERLQGKLTLGMAIRSIRLSDNKSQTAFAKLLGVSIQYLCDLEHNRKIVSPKKAKEFSEKLGHSSEQFVRLAIQDSLNFDGIDMLVDVKAA